MNDFDLEVASLTGKLDRLVEAYLSLQSITGGNPSHGSKADIELNSYPHRRLIETAHSQTQLLIEAVFDHAIAFSKSSANKVTAIAIWTITRGAAEAAGVGSWLYDWNIDATERVARSYAISYESITEHLALCKLAGNQAQTAVQREHVLDIENEAAQKGFTRHKDKNGRCIGLGSRLPTKAEFTARIFGSKVPYKVLCAMSHSDPAVLAQVAYMAAGPEISYAYGDSTYIKHGVFLTRNTDMKIYKFLCSWVFMCLSNAVWNQVLLFGWDRDAAAKALDEACSSYIDKKRRCWTTT